MWQVQYFITAMDGVKMDLRAKDQVQPLVSDVMSSLNRCDFLGTAFDKSKLEGWYVREQGGGACAPAAVWVAGWSPCHDPAPNQ